MDTLCEATEDMVAQTIELVGYQKLIVQNDAESSELRVVGPDGRVSLSIHVTERGPVLRLEGAVIQIEAQGDLSLNAERVAIHGRRSLALTSDGMVSIDTPGDIHSDACSQKITAHLGNVDIKANDDVTIDGERIRMNC